MKHTISGHANSILGNHTSLIFRVSISHVRQIVKISTYNFSSENFMCLQKKVKQSRNRPGVTQRVPGGLGAQTSMTFGT